MNQPHRKYSCSNYKLIIILQCLLLLSQIPEELSGEKVDDERLYEAVNVLLYLQSPISGGFAIWEPPVPQPYLQVM